MNIPFDNTYVQLPPELFHKQSAEPPTRPNLIAWNDALAQELGIDGGTDAEKSQAFGGGEAPAGAEPLAQLYAGHQFGHYNPQLGDGRALLLGEVIDIHGRRRDIQLKGSGRTPYSRGGDGRAWIGPVLREYVVSEAMHALGVPTTRALAAVTTGDLVYRERAYPGAVLTRVASSHIRVGTFQILAQRQQLDLLQALYEYTRARHYPDAETPVELLTAVARRQANLVARWMSYGFIHGVMNTDNCTLSGETIDYGPCAFQDRFDVAKVFSSIDHHGRYSYSAQADIIVWNMAQLANALLPLTPSPEDAVPQFQQVVSKMQAEVVSSWLTRFALKIGISEPTEEDGELIRGLLQLMHRHELDFTLTFHSLTNGTLLEDANHARGLEDWLQRWEKRVKGFDPQPTMQAANPWIIPRNHQVESAIQAALQDDFAPMHQLVRAVTAPFTVSDEHRNYAAAPAIEEEVAVTFCGT